MKKARFQSLLNQQHEILKKLTASKGEEYANSVDDQLANFRRLAADLNMPMEKVWLVYFTKHIDSIKSYIRGTGQGLNVRPTLSEPIEGRIDDAILYLCLLRGIITEQTEINPT